jgi:hypothetical protein
MTKMGKKAHVSEDTFAELMESAEQALAYERGQRADYRVTQVSFEHPRTTSRDGALGSTLRIRREHKRLRSK